MEAGSQVTMVTERMNRVKTRFNIHKFNRLRGKANEIIGKIAREQSTHDELLQLRVERLYQDPDWARLPRDARAELEGMLRGAVQAWYVSCLVWCHFYQGRYVEADAFHALNVSYSEIDSNLSAHCWKGTLKPFNRGRAA